MSVWKVLLMVLISLFVTATIMPIVLFNVPAVQNDRVGMLTMAGIAIVTFATIWLVWSRFGERK
jgi:predicted membrane channel-forming protein YqfA (hemolysin III family)